MSNDRQKVSTDTVWERLAGYSRAVRVGQQVFVAGTTATDDDGNVVGANDPAEQTRYILDKIERALQAVGAELTDVVRTRVYVTHIDIWEPVARVHGEYFADIRPANTLLVSALVGDEYLVEIDAEAIVSNG